MPERKGPAFEKAPPELVERFGQAMAGRDGVVQRKMFGYPAAFVGGNMTTGLFADQWFVRLPEPEQAELLAQPDAHVLEPMAGRPMRGYVVLPPAILDDATTLAAGSTARSPSCGRFRRSADRDDEG